jgi:hypothetical protein
MYVETLYFSQYNVHLYDIRHIYFPPLILHIRSELGTASPAGLHAIKKRMNSLPLVTFNPFISVTLREYHLYYNESTLFVMSSIYTLTNYDS